MPLHMQITAHTDHEGVVHEAQHIDPLNGDHGPTDPRGSNPIGHPGFASPRCTRGDGSSRVCVAPMILCSRSGATWPRIPPAYHHQIDTHCPCAIILTSECWNQTSSTACRVLFVAYRYEPCFGYQKELGTRPLSFQGWVGYYLNGCFICAMCYTA